MAWRVHQVEDVVLAVPGAILQPHRLRLDGDAALTLDVHGIEHLLLARHFAIGQAPRHLDQAVGQRRFAMVDMGDDGEVADVGNGGCGHGARDSIRTPRTATILLYFKGDSSRQVDSTLAGNRLRTGLCQVPQLCQQLRVKSAFPPSGGWQRGWLPLPAIPKSACRWSSALRRFMRPCGRLFWST